MQVTCVTIDCADPARVARFWSTALDAAEPVVIDGGAVVPLGRGLPYLEFIVVPEGKVVKNRVHLGCHAGDLGDLDGEIARLEALGASVAWEEDFPAAIAARYRNLVLLDVEGNEFCLGAGSFS